MPVRLWKARQQRKSAGHLSPRICATCRTEFIPLRQNSRYCSPNCSALRRRCEWEVTPREAGAFFKVKV